jgi:ATP-dependent helicase HrpA
LTRAAIDAAIPGLAAPRIEALLRSLPKDARRSLIPVAETATAFLADTRGATADATHLKAWLKERRAIPEPLLRFDPSAVPIHLTPQLAVIQQGREIARGTDLSKLRRECAAWARTELERHARAAYSGNWRRFELDQLPEVQPLILEQGAIQVFATLATREAGLQVQYEWSADEARHTWRDGSVRLARLILERQSRDLAKAAGNSVALLLRASPYLTSDALIDVLLQLTIRCACFAGAEPPRTRLEFEAAVEQGRERLYPCLEQMSAMVSNWLKEASDARQSLDDPRVRRLAAGAEETRQHLRRLLDFATINTVSPDWLRQLPRYLKAEQRRWQRNAVRGNESKHIEVELERWSARYKDLETRLAAELRWTSKLTEFRFWIEEYRVSLYAQELKTLGAISAARLDARAAEIDAWLSR